MHVAWYHSFGFLRSPHVRLFLGERTRNKSQEDAFRVETAHGEQSQVQTHVPRQGTHVAGVDDRKRRRHA